MLKMYKHKAMMVVLVLFVLGATIGFTSNSSTQASTNPVPPETPIMQTAVFPEYLQVDDSTIPVDTGIIVKKYIDNGKYLVTIRWHEPDNTFSEGVCVISEEEYNAMPEIGGSLTRLY